MPKFSKDYQPSRKAAPFSSTNQPKNRGRKPKLKSIPDDAKDKVYSALYHALTLPDQLGRRLQADEYEAVCNEAQRLGFYRGWIQPLDAALNYQPHFGPTTHFDAPA